MFLMVVSGKMLAYMRWKFDQDEKGGDFKFYNPKIWPSEKFWKPVLPKVAGSETSTHLLNHLNIRRKKISGENPTQVSQPTSLPSFPLPLTLLG